MGVFFFFWLGIENGIWHGVWEREISRLLIFKANREQIKNKRKTEMDWRIELLASAWEPACLMAFGAQWSLHFAHTVFFWLQLSITAILYSLYQRLFDIYIYIYIF